MILSVSRRTDIPNYYSEWFLNRLKEGYLYVKNPMNIHQVSKIDISPEVVDCIVFWTKNPEPMLSKLEQLRDYKFYFQFTLTGYGKDIEPSLPHKRENMIPIFQRLSQMIGKEKVIWRYDLIIFTDTYSEAYHLKAFHEIAISLKGYCTRVVISFVAWNMNQILEAANYYNVQLRFEATVGGAIPICRTIMNMSKNNKITRMFGIVNATTNYVISLMEQSNIDFNKALEIARKKGITENDSSEDIDGWDAAYKMKILTRIGMNLNIDCEEILPESSNTIERCKISDDASVRQIFYIERQEDNRILYYIGPAELEKNNIMGNVRENYNIIFVDSSCSGLRAYYGKGAGGKETASVMYEDLLDIYKQCYWFEAADEAVCKKINSKEGKMTLYK